MSILNDDELTIIKNKVSRNAFVKEATLGNKIGQDLYNKCLNNNLLEVKSGKSKFTTVFWKSLKAGKSSPQSTGNKSNRNSISNEELDKHILDIINPKIDQLVTLIQNLDNRLQKLEGDLTSSNNSNHKVSLEEFKNILKSKYDLINFNERRGGMIPIPKLWDEVEKEGIGRKQFEDDLFTLEKDRIIDLQIASDPKVITESDKSIKHPARGLINYVVWRR